MRICFMSDVHANFPALCAAVEAARRRKCDRVVVAGDVVGGGPHPVEVVRLLMEEKATVIRGNSDLAVFSLLGDPKKLKRARAKKKRALDAWTASELGGSEREWLQALPDRLDFAVEKEEVLVTHGSLASSQDEIFPSLTTEAMRARLGSDRPTVWVCGHTHIPFIKIMDGVRVINCGSVGRPVDGDPRGAVAFCDFGKGGRISTTVVRFPYAMNDLVSDIQSLRTPGLDGEAFLRGVWKVYEQKGPPIEARRDREDHFDE